MDNIDSIVLFDGKGSSAAPAPAAAAPEPTGEAATPVAAAATPAEPAKQERDEATGKFKAKTEAQPAAAATTAEPAAQPAQAQPEPARAEKGQMSALLAERAKRQQVEQRAAQLEARVAQLENSGSDVLADPDAALNDRIKKEIAPLKSTFFEQSIALAASAHEDFEEVIEHFMAVAETNPALREQWAAHENPGEFAYLVGSAAPQHREKRERTYKEQITAKDAEISTLKARVTELEASQKRLAEVPESLNRQPSGSSPARQDDEYDINKIVRFK
jgi:hypothetical protein